MEYLEYNDPLHIIWRNGTEEDPLVPITTTQKIINNIIVLDEIPDEFNRVFIDGYSEVFGNSEILSDNFKVNYQNGIIIFNPSEEGKTISAEYMGRGIILYPASRIYDSKNSGSIVKTLQDIVDSSVTKFIFSTEDPIDDDGNPNGTVWFKYIP